MCLAVPGRLARWIDRDPLLAVAEIDFGGVKKRCHMACVPDAEEGDYILVHAGVALTVIDQQTARQSLNDLASIPVVGRLSKPAAGLKSPSLNDVSSIPAVPESKRDPA